jgi:hypothetical protein
MAYFSAVLMKPAMRKLFLVVLVMTFFKISLPQTPVQKEIAAKRTSLPITIDGELNEEAWKGATAITNFVEQRPVLVKQKTKGIKPKCLFCMMTTLFTLVEYAAN